jgi:uncharacterized protein YndB with AHSA1/START domain
MPAAHLIVHHVIHAPPERIFDVLADLTRHGEWSANALHIEPLAPGPPAEGSRYRSRAKVNDLVFQAELEIQVLQRPNRLVFVGQDSTGQFRHQFSLTSVPGGTRVERRVDFSLSARQWLMYLVLLHPVRLPAARRALSRLAEHLEANSTLA